MLNYIEFGYILYLAKLSISKEYIEKESNTMQIKLIKKIDVMLKI